jgi:ATP-dependent Clp protease protease subunit
MVATLSVGHSRLPGQGRVAGLLCSRQSRPEQIHWNPLPTTRRLGDMSQTMQSGPNLAGLSAADRLLHQRIIVLGQEVDDAIANKLCAELLLLSAEDPRRDIALYINSPGGSVSAGLAIYDTMRLIPNDVATLAMGLAASMGQFLLSAGTPGKRFALPHSRVLMHQGSAGIGGTAIDIEIQAENLEHTKNVMMRLIAEHTGQPVEKIELDARRDRWFTAEEAREYGFVDQVLTDPRMTASVTPNRAGSAAFALRVEQSGLAR